MSPRFGGQPGRAGDELRNVLRDRIAYRHRFSRPGSLAVGRVTGWRDPRHQATLGLTLELVAVVVMRDRRHRGVQSYGLRRDMLH